MATTTRGRRTRRAGPTKQREREQQGRAQPEREQQEREQQGRAQPEREQQEPQRRDEPRGDGRRLRAAAEKAARDNSTHLRVPMVGEIELPPPAELAYLGGLAVLGLLGTVDWPVVVLLGAGHALVSSRRNKIVREFGEALEEA